MLRLRVGGRVSKWDAYASTNFDQSLDLAVLCKSLHENINSFELNSGVLQIASGIEFRVPEG